MQPDCPLEPLNETARIQLEIQVEVNKQNVIVCPKVEYLLYVYKNFRAKICPEHNLPQTVEPELEASTLINHYLLTLLDHN